jgi:hypothetical protein
MSAVDPSYSIPPIGRRLREAAREEGAARAARRLLGWGARYAAGLPRALVGSRRTFGFAGHEYRYATRVYNSTWMHERAVELPIALEALEQGRGRGARILEVGHVLGHYAAAGHEVVDKYEHAPGVRNADVLDLDAEGRYDLVLSVSTLEHVGVDDAPADPRRAVAAARRLRALTAPGGSVLATVPAGDNHELVAAIASGEAGFDDVRALVRAGPGLDWREATVAEACAQPYDRLLYRARAVLICRATP